MLYSHFGNFENFKVTFAKSLMKKEAYFMIDFQGSDKVLFTI